MNWPTFSMLKSKIPFTISCAPTAYAAPRSQDDLYTSADGRQSRDQLRTRQTAQSVPLLTDASALQVSPDELKAAILLFYSLLDEQQRRLFAGLESIKLGHGGDRILAEFLALDPHTVARGRQQLLDQNVSTGRTRRSGGGRKPVEKKPPTLSH